MDIASLIGFIGGLVVMAYTILASGEFGSYVDPTSIVCTIGGTVFMTIGGFPLKKSIEALKSMKHVFIYKEMEAEGTIKSIIDLANIARKEGLLALEEAAQQLNDNFLQKGILLIVDGTDPELVRNILETELAFIEERHKSNAAFYEYIAAMAPAFGMLGTLIGLINMLKQLSDVSSLGPNMAIAIITTFYGSFVANYICMPVVNKLKIRSAQEILMKEVMLEGMLSIQAGENPRIIEEKLKAFMSPSMREKLSADKDQSEGE
ncbi:MAG: motility protein A [Bacillota bacterium]